VQEHELQVRQRARQPRGALHLGCENLQLEQQPALGQPREIFSQLGIVAQVRLRRETIERIRVPVELHAHAAQER